MLGRASEQLLAAGALSVLLGVARHGGDVLSVGQQEKMRRAAVELADATVRFGAHEALSRVSLAFQGGEIALLTGPSGAGKSTLLKLVLGALTPSDGTVRIAGRDISKLTLASLPYVRRNIGMVFQDYRLLAGRTVKDNIDLALRAAGFLGAGARHRRREALEAVGLSQLASARVDQLSGGEQQRVAVARALASQPAIVLADEPTSNLDEDAAARVHAALRQAATRGSVVVIATHEQSLRQNPMADDCVVYRLAQGRLVAAPTNVMREARRTTARGASDVLALVEA